MVIGGCDPGADGAVCFIDAETMRVLHLIDMPMSAGELRVRELATDLLAALDGRRCGHLWIERQQPFAKAGRTIGATSAFNLGQRYMALKAIAACHGWPTEIIAPTKWKRHFGITTGSGKEWSLYIAGQAMPEDAGLWTARRGYCTRARGIGRAEAALIALFGIRSFNNIAAGVAA